MHHLKKWICMIAAAALLLSALPAKGLEGIRVTEVRMDFGEENPAGAPARKSRPAPRAEEEARRKGRGTGPQNDGKPCLSRPRRRAILQRDGRSGIISFVSRL